MRDPAFLFYYQDFAWGTRFMTFEEKGMYIDLLCEQADTGPMDENRMQSVCKTTTMPQRVVDKFKRDPNTLKYYNERLQIEVEKRSNYCNSRKHNKLDIKHTESIRFPYANRTINEDIDVNKDVKTIHNTSKIPKTKSSATAFEDTALYDPDSFKDACPVEWSLEEKEYWFAQACQSSNRNNKYKNWIRAVQNWRRNNPAQFSEWKARQPRKPITAAPRAICGTKDKDVDGAVLLCRLEAGHAGEHSYTRQANKSVRENKEPESVGGILERMSGVPRETGGKDVKGS